MTTPRPSPSVVPLAAAAHRTRTGDLWLFRGRSVADRMIQTVTNAPVNHVGVAVVLDDLPPLMWHAEMGRSLDDVWTGTRHRGVQLHVLTDAVRQWCGPYGQRAWFRQLDPEVGEEAEDALLETIARWDGVSFPSAGTLAGRWARGRWERRGRIGDRVREAAALPGLVVRRMRSEPTGRSGGRHATHDAVRGERPGSRAEAAYCAEVAGVTLEEMGVLVRGAAPAWYDPGRFWSGDELPLAPGFSYGREIAVTVDPGDTRPLPAD